MAAMAQSTMTERRREAHPLTQAFPLSVMTLAAFLVAFTILMARLHAGVDPALRRSLTPAALSRATSAGGRPVLARPSGMARASGEVAGGARSTPGSGPSTSVSTRTSGAGRGSEGEDDA
jgi:hypothetical protein